MISPFVDQASYNDSRSWRDYRNLSAKQRVMMDFITNQGPFAKSKRTQMYGLYGGAGWGGKSYLLRSAAFELNMVLRDAGCPNRWGVLYCDTYDNLKDRHIGKFEEEMQGVGVIQDTMKRGLHFKFHGEGLGGVYLRNLDTHHSKRGSERAYALFDEITEVYYEQFANALYTIRPDSAKVPFIAVLGATNPDGVGHQWVKDIFHPRYRNLDHPFFRKRNPGDVFFVQALKQDNPAYAQQKEIIDAIMAGLSDEDIRAARDDGSWDLYASGRFNMFRESIHCFEWSDLYRQFGIPEDVPPEELVRNASGFGFKIYSSLDYATSMNAVSAYLAHLVDPKERLWTFGRLSMVGKQLESQAEEILEFEKGLSIERRYADPSINGKAAEDQSGLTRRSKFARLGLRFSLAINDRVEGASTCASLLYWKPHPNGVGLIVEPKARFLRRQAHGRFGVPELIREIPNLPRDRHNPEDVDPQGGANHWYDSWRYMAHTRYRNIIKAIDKPVAGSQAYYDQLARAQKAKRAPKDDF